LKSANAYNELEANGTKESEAIAALTKENQTLQEQIEVLTQKVEDTNKIKKELKMHLQQLENQSRGKEKIYQNEKELLDDEIAELKEEIGRLQRKVKELLQALKSVGAGSKMEQKAGVKDEIKNWMNAVGFIDTKFALTDEAMSKLATDCYKEIAPRIGLEDEDSDSYLPLQDFIRIYTGFFNCLLSEARQYNQTQCFAAVESKSSGVFLILFRIS
jgi:prefoldin subunit 5